jgi:outer membrane lipoprotein-sorting protein
MNEYKAVDCIPTTHRGRGSMSARRLAVALCAALLASCSDADETPRDAAPSAAADSGTSAQMPVVADTGPLPPGLEPVAIDPDPRAAAPSRGPAPTPAPQPAGQASAPPQTAPASQDDGAAILRAAAAAYSNVRSMRADFTMTFANRLLRSEMTGRGTLYQQRPDRIALRFSDPEGEVILSDGTHFYVYQPGVNRGQAIRTPATGGSGGVDLQAQFMGQPTERFQFTLHGRENVAGRPAHVLTLVPKQRAEYQSLKVWIDTRDSLARRFEITEHNGSVRRFDLAALQVNVNVPADVFRFEAPPGVRIIDP